MRLATQVTARKAVALEPISLTESFLGVGGIRSEAADAKTAKDVCRCCERVSGEWMDVEGALCMFPWTLLFWALDGHGREMEAPVGR